MESPPQNGFDSREKHCHDWNSVHQAFDQIQPVLATAEE
jgi:hypothetical protein